MFSENIELNKLKGINLAYDNDLYEFAELVLRINYAIDKRGKTISKPTINGLARDYSMVCGQKITQNEIVNIAEKNGLDANEAIDFNKGDKRRNEPPKIGQKYSEINN